MISQSQTPIRRSPSRPPGRRRPAWRQRLVEAERGIAQGIRSDSSFFVYFFAVSVVVAAGLVFGITLLEWTVVVLALSSVLSAEMFNQVVKTVVACLDDRFEERARSALRIGTAAVFVTISGALLTIGLIIGQRLSQLITGS